MYNPPLVEQLAGRLSATQRLPEASITATRANTQPRSGPKAHRPRHRRRVALRESRPGRRFARWAPTIDAGVPVADGHPNVFHHAATVQLAGALLASVLGNALTLASSGCEPGTALARWNSHRQRALRRTGIESHRHHLTMRTADWAARNPTAVPYAVYPLPPAHCADLICDFSVVEVVASIDAILAAARGRGLEGHVLLPDAHGELTADQSLFRLTATNGRSVVVHTGVVNQLLAELVTVDSFLNSLEALLAHPEPPSNPIVVYRNEEAVWR